MQRDWNFRHPLKAAEFAEDPFAWISKGTPLHGSYDYLMFEAFYKREHEFSMFLYERLNFTRMGRLSVVSVKHESFPHILYRA